MPILTVIIGSTRPGRAGLPIAQWFVGAAKEHGGFEVQVADLAQLDLPMLDEPDHPRLRRYRHDHTKEWSQIVESSDAFVLVTAEYNYGYPAPVKNALDYLSQEWQYKPMRVRLVRRCRGRHPGGAAAQAGRLRAQLSAVNEAVNIPFHSQFLEDDVVRPNETLDQAAVAMLDELGRVEAALRPLRSPGRLTA